jgi:hypothetical protein
MNTSITLLCVLLLVSFSVGQTTQPGTPPGGGEGV